MVTVEKILLLFSTVCYLKDNDNLTKHFKLVNKNIKYHVKPNKFVLVATVALTFLLIGSIITNASIVYAKSNSHKINHKIITLGSNTTNKGTTTDLKGSNATSNKKTVIPSQKPVANTGPDQTVQFQVSVTLDGSKSNGNALTFKWLQTVPLNPTVQLNKPTTVKPTLPLNMRRLIPYLNSNW